MQLYCATLGLSPNAQPHYSKKDFPERAVLMGSGEAVLRAKINNFVYMLQNVTYKMCCKTC